MAVTIAEICDAVAVTLSAATGIQTVYSYDEAKESVHSWDCPALLVYPDTVDPNPNRDTERNTFKIGIAFVQITIMVDFIARLRSQIDLDNKAVVDGLDALITVLQDETSGPYFGLAEIKSFDWIWQRATLRYANSWYAGGRFTLKINVF